MTGVAVKLMSFAVKAPAAPVLDCIDKMTIARNSQIDL